LSYGRVAFFPCSLSQFNLANQRQSADWVASVKGDTMRHKTHEWTCRTLKSGHKADMKKPTSSRTGAGFDSMGGGR